jgi:hypothetical protein
VAKSDYIELIEIYPYEYYIPGSPVTAMAHWFRADNTIPVALRYPAKAVGTVVVVAHGQTNTATLTDSGHLLIIKYVYTTRFIKIPATATFLRGTTEYVPKVVTTTYRSTSPVATFTIPYPGGITVTNTLYSTTTVTTTYTTSTLQVNQYPINLRERIKSAVLNESLSGDMAVHYGGPVQAGRIIKVGAPILLLNYIYRLKELSQEPPSGGGGEGQPPSSKGGGGSLDDVPMVCETTGESLLSSQPESRSENRPVYNISGEVRFDFSEQTPQVVEIKQGVCRPVTPPRSLPSPA